MPRSPNVPVSPAAHDPSGRGCLLWPSWRLWLTITTFLLLSAACGRREGRGGDEGPPALDQATLLPVFDAQALAAARLESNGPPPSRAEVQTPPTPLPTAPLAVRTAGPVGPTSAWPDVSIEFSDAIWPLGAMPPVDVKALGLSVTPAIKGEWMWAAPDRLTFSPRRELPLATRFRVRAKGTLVAHDGRKLALDLDFSFETERPTVNIDSLDAYESGDQEALHWRAKLLVTGTQGISAASLAKAIRVRPVLADGARGDPIAVRIERLSRRQYDWMYGGDETAFVVAPVNTWPLGKEIVAEVGGSLRGREGPLGMGDPVARSFQISDGLHVESVDCYADTFGDDCGLGPIVVNFRTPVRGADIVDHVRLDPAIRGSRAQPLSEPWDERHRNAYDSAIVWGDVQLGRSYDVVVRAGMRDIYGQPLAGGGFRKTIRYRPPPATLALSPRSGVIEPSTGDDLGIEARWVDRVEIRWAKLRMRDAVSWVRMTTDDVAAAPWPNDVLAEGTLERTLPQTGDFAWSSVAIPLRDLTAGATGPILVEVRALSTTPSPSTGPNSIPKPARAILQVSPINAVVIASLPKTIVQVFSPRDGAAVEGVTVRARGADGVMLGKTVTGPSGIADLPARARGERGELSTLELTRGEDRLLVDVESIRTPGGRAPSEDTTLRRGEELLGQITTERAVYRPGEPVYVVGWAAVSSPYSHAALAPLAKGTAVELELVDRKAQVVAKRKTSVAESGKFSAKLSIPARGSLGSYVVRAKLAESGLTANVRVEDYRVPDFEVGAQADRGDLHHGDPLGIHAYARYYFGGTVKISSARAVTECREQRFRPPGLDPAWLLAKRNVEGRRFEGVQYATLSTSNAAAPGDASALWAEGKAQFQGFTSPGLIGLPYACTTSVAVRDATQQEIGAEATFAVHPDFYLAVARVQGGIAPLAVQVPARAVDFNGERLTIPVEMKVHRTYWTPQRKLVEGESVIVGWDRKTETRAPCKLTTTISGADSVCDLGRLPAGEYRVEVEGQGARHDAQTTTWFAIRDPERERWRPVRKAPDRLTIDVGDGNAKIGDGLVVQIAGPVVDGRGVLVVAAGGLRAVHPFQLQAGVANLELPVDESMVPDADVSAWMVVPHRGVGLAKLETATAKVHVGTVHRALSVDVEAPLEAAPRQTLPIEVRVRDHEGKPTGGYVTVWAVDEAVLALAEHNVPDLVRAFTKSRGHGLSTLTGLRWVVLAYTRRGDPYAPMIWAPSALRELREGWGYGYGRGGGAGFGGRSSSSPSVRMAQAEVARERFETAPIFIGDAKVGADGTAIVRGKLPDNLTTFRITAIASASVGSAPLGRFGSGEARVRVTQPLVLRAVLPRVMRVGDRAEIVALADNRSVRDGVLEASAELLDADGRLRLISADNLRAPLGAGGQVSLRFRVEASGVGPVRVKMRAAMRPGDGSEPITDTVILPLPVEVERTMLEHVAVYGTLAEDRPVALPIAVPSDASRDHGGLTVDVSATLLSGLRDAVQYLVNYPYGCAEQTSSRLIPLIALGELAERFDLGEPKTIDAMAEAGIERLVAMQRPDGAFGYWSAESQAYPWVTAYATWVLVRARAAGRQVPELVLDNAARALREHIDRAIASAAPSPETDATTVLAALTLGEMDKSHPADLEGPYARRRQLPYFVRVQLWHALGVQAARHGTPNPRVTELGAELRAYVDVRNDSARVETTSGRWWTLYDSDDRSTAMLLSAMLAVTPDDPLVPQLGRGLMEARRAGRWANTQENAYAVLAMADYARVYEAEQPRFRGRVWMGASKLGEVEIAGDRFAQVQSHTPMAKLAEAEAAAVGPAPLLLERNGSGRMYYRIGMSWTTPTTATKAIDRGIGLRRSLRSAAESVADGDSLVLGEIYAIDIEVTTSSELTFVAVEVPLPAGLEAINLDLGRGSAAMKLSGRRAGWVSHQELHRDRALLFADELRPGTYNTTVFVRATTSGDFHMPAARAEMMYYPEIYGRTTPLSVVVR